MLAHFHREGDIDAMEGYMNSCRQYWTDWMLRSSCPNRLGRQTQYRQRRMEREVLVIRKRLSNTEGHGVSLRSSLCLLHQAS